jgi:hypothetical protein
MKKDQTTNCWYLYRHIRLDRLEPFYIGIGSDKSFKRANRKIGRNAHWNNITAKTDYRVEILITDLSLEEIKIKECYFIKVHGRADLGLGTLCNKTDGGEGTKGLVITEANKQRLREIQTGKKASKETKLKMSESQKGNKNSLGHKHSEQRKLQIGEFFKGKQFNLGRKLSDEVKEKLRIISSGNKYGLGYKHSEESKLKMSEARKGNKNAFFGKSHTLETLKKLRIPKSEEWKAKLRKPKSEEAKANMKAAWVLRKGKKITS